MPKNRYQPPDRLIGATDFSKRPDLCGSMNIVRLVKSQRWAWDELREACAALESNYARKREPGHWELVMIAFVVSGQVDIQPWWANTADELWRECGFRTKPSYPTVHRRLRELGKKDNDFLKAAERVIQRCYMHDSHVLAHPHFDWTEDETHVSLVHDCGPNDPCKRRSWSKSRQRWGRNSAVRVPRAATSVAREHREAWNAEEPVEAEQHAREAGPEAIQHAAKGKRVKFGGCWFWMRDEEAGVRAYTSNGRTRRSWVGFYSGKAICTYTGGVIPSVDSASTQECHLFPALYDRVKAMRGKRPETAIGDKGLSVSSCFEHATKNDTAPIFPWRGNGNPRHDHPRFDRHGVKRCDHCGGVMYQTRFSANNGKPRLWFRCTFQLTPDCAGEQTIYCSEDWRTLVPLSRTNALYHELKESHQAYEGVHDYWRDRYKVASDTLANRPKAIGLDWHRLRASVACFVDWLRIAAKVGWLGSTRSAQRHAGSGARRSWPRRLDERREDTRPSRPLQPLRSRRQEVGAWRGDAALPPAARRPAGLIAASLARRTRPLRRLAPGRFPRLGIPKGADEPPAERYGPWAEGQGEPGHEPSRRQAN